MRKFIAQTSIFIALLSVGFLSLILIVPKQKNFYHGFALGYMQGVRVKHMRAQAINGPKIVFAGGSNLAYSLNSEKVEKKLAVPVVNMGLHAGFGVQFIVDEVEKVINQGDIVILSFEYFMAEGDYRLKRQTCNLFPEVADLQQFSVKQEVQTYLDETREALQKYVWAISAEPKPEATISSWEIDNYFHFKTTFPFNHYGDCIEHLEETGWYERRPDEVKFQYKYWKGIEYLNEFKAEAEAKGVSVFFSYAPFSKSAFEVEFGSIDKFHRDLTNDLNIELLGTPHDFVFENDLFYDREYHLIREGRELRTERLLQLLEKSEYAKKCIDEAAKVHAFK